MATRKKIEAGDDSTFARLAVPLDVERDHVLGSACAPVALIEYGDYECPDCGCAHPIIRALRERFGGDRLLFAFRHFPQYTIHRHASAAAQAAEAAGAQGKFWAMHDMLYANQNRIEPHDLSHYALRIGLDPYRFESDLTSGRFSRRVEENYAGGERSGVRGTPTLFINGGRYTGQVELEPLAAAIKAATGAARE